MLQLRVVKKHPYNVKFDSEAISTYNEECIV